MKLRFLISFMLLAFGLWGCAKPTTVSHTFDEEADFSSYHSWFWLDGIPAMKDVLLGGDMTDQFIRRAITNELISKGLKVQVDNPDLLVKFSTSFRQAVSSMPGDLGYSYQWRWVRQAPGKGEPQSYSKGTLVVDLIDRKTGLLVWQGSASGAVSDEQEAQGKIPQAVKDIFAPYPPSR